MDKLYYKFWRFRWAIGYINHPRFKKIFGKLYWFKKYPRFKDSEYNKNLCSWCKEITSTKNHEIWCSADERGRIVCLCDACAESCAGG